MPAMKNTRVSVIIPMYCASPFIKETLESVRSQTYEYWELIIVDDGSPDASAEKAREFVAQFPGMAQLLFHPGKENRGTSASRNLGLEHATGELVCFLDADDVWDSGFLDFFVQMFDRNPEIAMAYGPALLWHGQQDDAVDHVQHLGIKMNSVVDSCDLFKKFLAGEADTPSPSGVLLRRKALLDVGGWEESFPGMYDDQVVYSKLLLAGGGAYVTDRCLYRYRQHPDSLCKVAAKERRNAGSRQNYLEWLRQYLIQAGQLSGDIEILIAEHIWYVQRMKEIEQLSTSGWWDQKMGALGSLLNLLHNQKNFISAIKLGQRIVRQQLGIVGRASKGSGH
ncbi:MAG: glycosyltransferase family A protein [Pseudomonadota bacterium]